MTFVQKEYESNNAMDITVVKATIVFQQTTYFKWNDSSPGEVDYDAKCLEVMQVGMSYFSGLLFLELLESSFLISQPTSYSERKL